MNYSNTNILTQMPSLIQPPCKLEFGIAWPLNRNLPPLTANGLSSNQEDSKAIGNKRRSKNQVIRACPHTNKKIFAKQMCHSCYQSKGRDKKAWNCEHKNKPHYAKGMCQLCYLKEYYQNKKDKYQEGDQDIKNTVTIQRDQVQSEEQCQQQNNQLIEDSVYQPEVESIIEGIPCESKMQKQYQLIFHL